MISEKKMLKIIIFVVIWSGRCQVVKRHDWNSLRWHSTDHDLKGIHGSKPIGPGPVTTQTSNRILLQPMDP